MSSHETTCVIGYNITAMIPANQLLPPPPPKTPIFADRGLGGRRRRQDPRQRALRARGTKGHEADDLRQMTCPEAQRVASTASFSDLRPSHRSSRNRVRVKSLRQRPPPSRASSQAGVGRGRRRRLAAQVLPPSVLTAQPHTH